MTIRHESQLLSLRFGQRSGADITAILLTPCSGYDQDDAQSVTSPYPKARAVTSPTGVSQASTGQQRHKDSSSETARTGVPAPAEGPLDKGRAQSPAAPPCPGWQEGQKGSAAGCPLLALPLWCFGHSSRETWLLRVWCCGQHLAPEKSPRCQ